MAWDQCPEYMSVFCERNLHSCPGNVDLRAQIRHLEAPFFTAITPNNLVGCSFLFKSNYKPSARKKKGGVEGDDSLTLEGICKKSAREPWVTVTTTHKMKTEMLPERHRLLSM